MALVNTTFFGFRNVVMIVAVAIIGQILFAKARGALDGGIASDAN